MGRHRLNRTKEVNNGPQEEITPQAQGAQARLQMRRLPTPLKDKTERNRP